MIKHNVIYQAMNTEQKAKAYDEAIKRAKYYQKENGSAVISAIFPELKEESEDDRIRKNIKIALISVEEELADFYSTHHTSQEEFLAWLEKQSEQKPDDWGEEDKKELEVIIDELTKYVMFNQYGTSLSVYDISWLEKLPSRFITQQQQKQEWSEEDKIDTEILNAAILFVVNNTDEFACNGVSKEDVINWLKSLKQKIKEK
jgi:hypothetical protein